MATPADFLCRWCGAHHGSALFEATDTATHRWQLVRCATCRVVSLTPWPSAEQLAEAYSDTYYGVGDQKFTGPVECALDRFREHRARRCSRLIPRRGTVLDVGCGNGGFLAALGRLGDFHLHGVEMPGKSAERAAQRPGLTLHIGPFDQQSLAPQSFDLVSMFHVFEHLPSPQRALESVARILKPGGHAVLSMPNLASVQARLWGRHWLHLDPPRHLHFIEPAEFRKFTAGYGLAVTTERYWSLEQNPFGFIQSGLNALLRDRDVLYERLKGDTAYAPKHGPLSLFLQKAFAALALGPAILFDAIESGLGRGATVEYTLRKSLGESGSHE